MSDASKKSPESKPTRRLKIGSQRGEADSTARSSTSPDSESTTDDAPSLQPRIDAQAPETPPHQEVVSPTPAAAPGEEASGVDMAEALVQNNFSDEDLEREIAAALGAVAVDDLLAGEAKSGPEDVEIEIDRRYTATVAKIYRESVLFELPGRRNGVVPLKQFENPPEPGATLEVVVVGFTPEEQLYELIVPGASVEVADWSDLAEGIVVEAKITGHNKGGLECEVNHIRGFIPASQVALYRVEDFSTYVDEKLPCVVTEASPERRNLVLSHRAVLEREKEEAREKLLAELAVGQTREGVVTRLQNFGAFVDLGGVDGLIHISQLSWDQIRHPSEVLEEGQRVKVRIEKIDPASGKIGLAYRDLMHHPWEGIDSKYPIGGIVKGIVSKLMDFGAFVKLEPGVEGLVHISELSHKRVTRVAQVVEEGQEVEVKILTIDPEAQRISLSIKDATTTADTHDGDDQTEETGDAATSYTPKRPLKTLKGGTSRSSGGEQFGLNW